MYPFEVRFFVRNVVQLPMVHETPFKPQPAHDAHRQ